MILFRKRKDIIRMIKKEEIICPRCKKAGTSIPTGIVKFSNPPYHEFKCSICGNKFDILDEDNGIKVFMSDEDEVPFLGGLIERDY